MQLFGFPLTLMVFYWAMLIQNVLEKYLECVRFIFNIIKNVYDGPWSLRNIGAKITWIVTFKASGGDLPNKEAATKLGVRSVIKQFAGTSGDLYIVQIMMDFRSLT